MEVTQTAHSPYRLAYPVIWVGKYRRRILNFGVCCFLQKALTKLPGSMPGVVIETIGVDHSPLPMVLPKYRIARVMGRLKSNRRPTQEAAWWVVQGILEEK